MEFTHTRACVIGAIPHVKVGVIKLAGPNNPSKGPVLSDCYKEFPLQGGLAVLLMELFD